MNQQGIDLLNDANAIGILLMTYNDKRIHTSDMRRLGGSYERLKRVADSLIAGGLMKRETIKRPYLTFIYSLTEKGTRVAEKLLEIDEIIIE